MQSQFPPASASQPTHFVIRVSGKPAGFMETFEDAQELAQLMNEIPGCPAVTVEELDGPLPDDHDAALRKLRGGSRSKVENDVAIPRARPQLRLIKGGR